MRITATASPVHTPSVTYVLQRAAALALQLSGLLTQTPERQIQRLQIPVQVVFAQRVE